MYDRILVPTDGSDGAKVALDHALEIAAAHGSTVQLLNVADTTRTSATRIEGQVVDTLEQEGERIVDEATERAEDQEVDALTDVVQGKPYAAIVEYADVRDIDLLVMPAHGRRGLGQYLLGSTTERVLRRSDVPVLTVPVGPDGAIEYPYRDVLVPTDGSGCANRALEMGIEVANAEGATLHLLSVVALTTFGAEVQDILGIEDLTERANELIEDATSLAEDAGVERVFGTVQRDASISGAIRSYVEGEIDLVVVGTHGRTGFDRYVLGSVAERLVRTAPVPVLTVREPTQGE